MSTRMLGLAMIVLAGLQLAACSTYGGPVTNAPPPSGLNGLPLLTKQYAP